TWRRCASVWSRNRPLSGTPRVHAFPALVVASASNPIPSSATALPTSQGFGITKQPASCRRRKAATLSSCWLILERDANACVAFAEVYDRANQRPQSAQGSLLNAGTGQAV